MKVPRRRKIFLALAVLFVVAVYVVLFVPFGPTTKDADQIRLNMTLPEVERILGRGEFENSSSTFNFHLPDGIVALVFVDGHVISGVIFDSPRGDRWMDATKLQFGIPPKTLTARMLSLTGPAPGNP